MIRQFQLLFTSPTMTRVANHKLTLQLALLAAIAFVSSARPPNVLVFFVDDLGYFDLGCQGNASVASPRIDQLAADGVRFTQWLSGSSICTPSRGALMTGRLPIRIGLASSDFKTRVFHPTSPTGLPHEELTIAEALQERGYSTHMTGKWHLGIGRETKWLPTHHGFENYYGMPITNVQSCAPGKTIYKQPTLAQYLFENLIMLWSSIFGGALILRLAGFVGNRGFASLLVLEGIIFALAWYITSTYTLMSPKNCLMYRNEDIIQQPVKLANLTQRLTADALGYIKRASRGDKPWFLYMSYVKVHTALFNHESFGEVNYLNNIAELDWSIGAILDEVEAQGLTDDTLVWFASDNGPFKERGHEGGSSGPLRGAKGQTYEGGIRIPGMVRYPRRFPAGQVLPGSVSTMDIFPTTLALVDAELAPDSSRKLSRPFGMLDGKDISAYAAREAKSSPHEIMFHYCGEELSAVRLDSRYKAHFSTAIWEPGLDSCPTASICGCSGSSVQIHSPPLLFDLVEDISESKPLLPSNFSAYADLQQRISDAVHAHRSSFSTYPSQPNQMKLWQDLSILPCCDPPRCECDKDGAPSVTA